MKTRFRENTTHDIVEERTRLLLKIFCLIFVGILVRLFYWQVVKSDSLQVAAEEQYQRAITTQGERGAIMTSDGYTLVTNTQVYRLFVQPHLLKESPPEITNKILPIILSDSQEYKQASTSAEKETIEANLKASMLAKLSDSAKKWIKLKDSVSQEARDAVMGQHILGIGFDPYLERSYPEQKMAAHVLGFVGKNDDGEDIGYFGIEGALEKELQARTNKVIVSTDALGQQLLTDPQDIAMPLNGRTIVTTIRRDLQHMAETELDKGMEKYGAKSGEVIIYQPKTGAIIALATAPRYNPEFFYETDASIYKNPSIASLYEPGSTFKILTVAAGLDAHKITPFTPCPNCSGPRTFGQYTIKTWNEEYHPSISMTDALAKSDNIAMIFIAELLGADPLKGYLQKFGIGEETHLEIQEDTTTPFPSKWGPVELATYSFGQGIATTSLQLVRAVGAVANKGVLMKPRIIEKVIDPTTGEEIVTPVVEERRVISEESSKLTTQMMVASAHSGEAQWTRSKTHTIAAKTGTSQIAINGSYDENKTIASFIGFAPPEDPEFVMLVKLVEPQSSIWAAETAAPLWYSIADKLFMKLNIQADRAE